MQDQSKRIQSALISVYHKEGLENIIKILVTNNIDIYSTGGTFQWIREMGHPVKAVEDLTSYPSILGGRVKTLHPKVFGGILGRRENVMDQEQMTQYGLPWIDLVIVDLYPFEATLASGASEEEVIEKIDIGGISLIRAAAKNFRDVLCVASSDRYAMLENLLTEGQASTTLAQRRDFARHAFSVSSAYDAAIFAFFDGKMPSSGLRLAAQPPHILRYGENPHQEGRYFGDLAAIFDILHGKPLSYNNLMDFDAGLQLVAEFDEPVFAILKHNNACGIAIRPTLAEAWDEALAADPVSAYGGILICNRLVDKNLADTINPVFFEIIAAPEFTADALEVLKTRKNRIILQTRPFNMPGYVVRSALNGYLVQSRDEMAGVEGEVVTSRKPEAEEWADMLFALRVVKHTRSNAIVLARNRSLAGSGMGQTSRVDALKQAIQKARSFERELEGAVMASDAFFPFSDSVEIAYEAGIRAVIQPGGSIRDEDSIRFCNEHGMTMVFTGVRHFRH